MKDKKYSDITKAQRKRIKDISTVECFVCKDSKNRIYNRKAKKYSELIN